MTEVPLKSSALQSAEYNYKEKSLKILFKDGTSTTYTGVPVGTYRDLLTAKSHGEYFNKNIRDIYGVAG